ncbi:hypothetical protein D3C83_97350 [compost metagenome]
MLVATRAVLLPLDALGMRALVLRGEVVPVLALAAGEDDLVAGHKKSLIDCVTVCPFVRLTVWQFDKAPQSNRQPVKPFRARDRD